VVSTQDSPGLTRYSTISAAGIRQQLHAHHAFCHQQVMLAGGTDLKHGPSRRKAHGMGIGHEGDDRRVCSDGNLGKPALPIFSEVVMSCAYHNSLSTASVH